MWTMYKNFDVKAVIVYVDISDILLYEISDSTQFRHKKMC